MNWQLSLVCLAFLTGCAGAPSAPGTPDPNGPGTTNPLAGKFDQPQREGQAFSLGGTVTLNGSGTTDPSYESPPFTVAFNGKSGDVALLSLSPTALPTATNNVRCKLQGSTTTYPTQNYNTVGATNYLPILITKSEPVTLNLYNSNTEVSPVFNQACRWTGSIRTAATIDPGEPNDDENAATIDDRGMATPYTLGTTVTRVLFYRSPAGCDEEDWYSVPLQVGHHYRSRMITSNGLWGGWNLSFGAFDAAGNPLGENTWTSTDTGARSFYFTPFATGTHYLRAAGTPVYRRGTSLDFQEYSFSLEEVTDPVVTGVTPTDAMAGSTIQLHATGTGHITSWSWTLGDAGTILSAGDTADPTVVINGEGTYSATCTAWDSGSGASAERNFTLRVCQLAPTWQRHLKLTSDWINAVAVTVLPGPRVALAYVEGATGRLQYTYSGPGIPSASAHWAAGYYLTGAGQAEGELTMAVVNDMPVIVYYNPAYNMLGVARATTYLPTAASQWSIKGVDAVGDGVNPSVVDLGGRIGIAHYDKTNSALRFSRALTDAPSVAGDWKNHTLDNAHDTGRYLSATMSQGRPVIAYSDIWGPDYSAQQVKFALASSSQPSTNTDWTKQTIMVGVRPSGVSLSAQGERFGCAIVDEEFGATIFMSTLCTPVTGSDWKVTNPMPERVSVGRHCIESMAGRWVMAGGETNYAFLQVMRARTLTPDFHGQWSASLAANGAISTHPSTTQIGGRLLIAEPSYAGVDIVVADANNW